MGQTLAPTMATWEVELTFDLSEVRRGMVTDSWSSLASPLIEFGAIVFFFFLFKVMYLGFLFQLLITIGTGNKRRELHVVICEERRWGSECICDGVELCLWFFFSWFFLYIYTHQHILYNKLKEKPTFTVAINGRNGKFVIISNFFTVAIADL